LWRKIVQSMYKSAGGRPHCHCHCEWTSGNLVSSGIYHCQWHQATQPDAGTDAPAHAYPHQKPDATTHATSNETANSSSDSSHCVSHTESKPTPHGNLATPTVVSTRRSVSERKSHAEILRYAMCCGSQFQAQAQSGVALRSVPIAEALTADPSTCCVVLYG
jgi:hypothetical protein